MNILLLCDRESAGEMRDTLKGILAQMGHDIEIMEINREEIRPCVNCFGCGFKTPGMCVITGDPANTIAEKMIRTDTVVLLSRITYGGFSADVKAIIDRSAPQNLMLSGFEMYKGQMHHPMRYKRWPVWIAVGYGDVSDGERSTFETLTKRNALNIHPDAYLAVTARDGAELSRKADSILHVLEGAKA